MREEDDDQEDEWGNRVDDDQCPYCASSDGCEHLLLAVDTYWRTIIGGPLYEKVSKGWREWATGDEEQDYDTSEKSEAFDEYLRIVSDLADEEHECDIEGGPGQSTTHRRYYCSSAQRVVAAVKSFRVGDR
jgi:hypothetical protein